MENGTHLRWVPLENNLIESITRDELGYPKTN